MCPIGIQRIFINSFFIYLPCYIISINTQQDLQVRRWKTSYDQQRICYIGDLPNDFLQVKLSTQPDRNNQLMVNKLFILF